MMISITKDPPSSDRRHDDTTTAYNYEGNIQLLEGRFLELASSVRALYKSNEELHDALGDCPNDPDFIQAIHENIGIMKKQQAELVQVVNGMRNLGANVEIPDDIRVMDVDGSVVPPSTTDPTFQQQQQQRSNRQSNTGTTSDDGTQETVDSNALTVNQQGDVVGDQAVSEASAEEDHGFYL
jgi:hypothetical protein